MVTATRFKIGSIWTPKTDGSEALHIPMWHPSYGSNPATYISKDRNALSCARTGGVWGKYGWTADGDDKIIISHTATLSFAGSFYLAAWAKFTDLTQTNRIIDKMALNLYNYDLYMNTTNPHITLVLYDGTNNPIAHSANNSIADTNTFYFVEAIVTKGVTAQCFVNLVGGTAVTENTGTITNTADIGIGHRILATADYAKAIIGEVWAYPRVPTLAERTQKYQNTKWRYNS